MHQAAATSQSYTVSTKDFNSSVTPQIPAELAPWVTRAVHERRLLDRLPVVGVTAPSLEIIRHTSTTGAAAPSAEGAVKPGIVGYAAAGLGEISERAGMTKGAPLPPLRLQRSAGNRHHRTRHQPHPRRVPPRVPIILAALENMIHGVFVVTDLLVSDKTACTAEQLTLRDWPNSTAQFSRSPGCCLVTRRRMAHLPTFAPSTNTPKDARWLVEEVIRTRCRLGPSSVRGRIWRSQARASAAGRGSRMPRSQSTVRLMPLLRSVSGFQPSTRPARVGSSALA